MEAAATHSDQPLEEIAVRQGPFAAALTPEEAEGLPRQFAQLDLRGDVLLPADRVLGVEALLRAGRVGGVDEVTGWLESLADRRQVLRPRRQLDLLRVRRPGRRVRPATGRRTSMSRPVASG